MMDLDINAYYFHSLILGREDTLKVLENILKCGKVLSINKGGYDGNNMRMNTHDEICLSKKNNLGVSPSAYDLFTRKKVSLIIKGNLPNVYRPMMVEENGFYKVDPGKTTLYDEYRIKDEIPLEYVVGINLPVGFVLNSGFGYKYFFGSGKDFNQLKFISSKNRYNSVVSFYEEIKSIMKRNNIDLDIYDMENRIKINSSSDIEKIKKKR